MIAVRSNFFYTRTVPCELWFLNRAKDEVQRGNVLMIDARNVYRKVTRKIYDFSPEQEQNLLAIVWLYRGQQEKFLRLLADYGEGTLAATVACFDSTDADDKPIFPLPDYLVALAALRAAFADVRFSGESEVGRRRDEFDAELTQFARDCHSLQAAPAHEYADFALPPADFVPAVDGLGRLAERSRDLIRQGDLLYKLAGRLIDAATEDAASAENADAKNSVAANGNRAAREWTRLRKAADEARAVAVDHLKQVRYFWRQAHWLAERFPHGELCDVPGLVKVVDHAELAANDWSLTPGRYVGVAPEEVDEDFDFEETLREIHIELADLNAEAAALAATIKRNFEELGI